MDTSKLTKELETEVDNFVGISDDTSDEYKAALNTVQRLNQVVISQEDLNLKKIKVLSDDKFRDEQLKFEKKKHKDDLDERQKDRDLDETRERNRHQEKMEELKINRLKAENEAKVLDEQKKKSSREFKVTLVKEGLIFLGKVAAVGGILAVNMLAHANELHFERVENGIVPSRCKGYDATMNKMAEVFIK